VVLGCGGTATTLSPSPAQTATPTPTSPIAAPPAEPWILYSWWSQGDPDRHVFRAHPDGSGTQRLLAGVTGAQASPVWSPNGTQFAFDGPSPAIWTATADGTAPSKLTDGEGQCPDGLAHPSWSPDGSTLAFICYPDPNGKQGSVAILDIATKHVTRLMTVDWPEHLDGPPTWSPDGGSLAVAILHWDPTDTRIDGSLIAIVPVAGGKERRITTFDSNLSGPDWSPDGSQLVTFSYDIGNMHTTEHASNLYLIDPDGNNLRQLTTSSVDGNLRIVQPLWSSDGTRLVCAVATSSHMDFTADDLRIAFVDPTGGEPVLVVPAIHGSQPDLQPVVQGLN
jgi:Tol biopolymer transport system component